MSKLDDLVKRVQELEAENHRLKVENRVYETDLESLVKARTEQLQTALRDLERSYDITLQALGDALDLKERSSEGHSRRVCAFTMGIARAFGISQDRVASIARGAFLHDIGKMAVPDKILLKNRDLSPEETAIMRQHCFLGYQIIKKIPFLAEASEIVYAHHERYDGTGYPRKLAGKEIPLGARIVAVANTLDSITSDLPYRAARSLAVARREIQNWSARQFDPEVVAVFMQMPDDIFDELRHAINART